MHIFFSFFCSLRYNPLCSLAMNTNITEATWIKIAEAVAASKTLTNLK